MVIVGVVLGVVALVPALLMLLPVLLYACWERGPGVSASSVSVLPLAGLVGIRLSSRMPGGEAELMLLRRPVGRLKLPRVRARARRKDRVRHARPLPETLALLKSFLPKGIGPLFSFLWSTRKAFRVRFIRYDAVLGSGDPASTGQLFGYLQGIMGALDTDKVQGSLTPAFDRRVLEGTVRVGAHIRPYRILGTVIAFAARVLWRLAADQLEGRWRRRQGATP